MGRLTRRSRRLTRHPTLQKMLAAKSPTGTNLSRIGSKRIRTRLAVTLTNPGTYPGRFTLDGDEDERLNVYVASPTRPANGAAAHFRLSSECSPRDGISG